MDSLTILKLQTINSDITHYQTMIEKHLNKVIELQAEREELLEE